MSVFDQFHVAPIINAAGPVTRLGGALMPPAVLDAFCEAACESVPMDQLQAAASKVISEITGAESGLVTAGAASSLTLGTAAILCGYDVARMERLPHVDGTFPDELIVAREHRNGYDHAARAAGARLVEVGFQEMVAGAGVRRVEAWEYANAFSLKTAGVLFVWGADSKRILPEVVSLAHQRGLPVLVDAAGRVPPCENLRGILATGADLVAFSGGKSIRGPQSTGILGGRRDLIGSAALQLLDMDDHFELWDPPAELIDKSRLAGMPRHGICRAHKVSKEEIVALLTALRMFAAGEYLGDIAPMRTMLQSVAAALETCAARTHLLESNDSGSVPLLEIAIDEARLGRSAVEICRQLRLGKPAIHVGQRYLYAGKLVIHPLLLRPTDVESLIRGLRELLSV